MKKVLLFGLTLLVSISSFASSESTPSYLKTNEKIIEMIEKVRIVDENHFSIILSQRVDLNFYDYIPGIGYLTLTSALENAAEDDGINDIMDIYCSQEKENESKADSIETSFGDATGCQVQQSHYGNNDTLGACIRYDFSCK